MKSKQNPKKIKYNFLSKKGTDRLYHILYWPFYIVFSIFHPVKVIGKENIPPGAAVVTPNHSAYADPPIAIAAFGYRYPLRIMGKEEVFRIPVLSRILIKIGMFGIRRGQSDTFAIKHALKVLKEGSKLTLFPEGTRVHSGDPSQSAKTGAILFASRTGAPLLPVFIPQDKKWFHLTRVVIGEPYHPDVPQRKATQEDYQRAADDLLDRIYALKKRLSPSD